MKIIDKYFFILLITIILSTCARQECVENECLELAVKFQSAIDAGRVSYIKSLLSQDCLSQDTINTKCDTLKACLKLSKHISNMRSKKFTSHTAFFKGDFSIQVGNKRTIVNIIFESYTIRISFTKENQNWKVNGYSLVRHSVERSVTKP